MKSLLPLVKAISRGNTDLNTQCISDRLTDFTIDSGVAAFLIFCSKNTQHKSTLKAADLTAKIITHVQLQALEDLLQIATPEIKEIILLKGICTCQNIYPRPHLRIMGDIDILVHKNDSELLKNTLQALGYQQQSPFPESFYQFHHHSMPFYNEKNNVWIEVHKHLFSGSNPALKDSVFSTENIFKNSIIMNAHKFPENVKQLCPELQLIYTCVHWADELKIHKACVQIIDMILLIKNNGEGLDWAKIFSWISNTSSASSVFLLLSYLDKYNLSELPKNHTNSYKLKHRNMGIINTLILHKIISLYVMGKKPCNSIFNENNLTIVWFTLLQPSPSIVNLIQLPWNIIFPPKQKNRFTLRLLLSRIKNMIISP
jgi:Uncharacterised nucleotidyltransferase